MARRVIIVFVTVKTRIDYASEALLGAQVRRIRLAQDVDQETLAARANISTSALRNLETGRGARLTTLVSALRALGREDWLATLEPEPEPGPFDQAYGRPEPQRASKRRGA